VYSTDRFRYRIVENARGARSVLSAELRPDGVVCFLPRPIDVGAVPDDDLARIVVFDVDNGTGAGPLEIHTYDLGRDRGLRVVGLVRRERD
jgi:hypothetical protein